MSALAPPCPALSPEVQSVIDTAVERLVAEFQPEQIWLFGSYAWGEPTPDSDLDLVVVVSDSDVRPLNRAQRAQLCLVDLLMPEDVLVKTRAEFNRFGDVVSSLTYKITREGRLVYETRPERTSVRLSSASHFASAQVGTFAEDRSEEDRREAKSDWIRSWLKRASSALRTVCVIAEYEDGPLGPAIFHCQQAAEKALKGYLAFADQPLQKTGNVEELLVMAVAIEPRFAALESDAAVVKPYSNKYRYPSPTDPLDPTRAEFDAALAAAQRIYDFVLSQLPRETHPV